MSDFINIRVTEADCDLIMNALDLFARAHDGDTGALELHDDIFEQVHRRDDPEWRDPIGEGFSFSVAENDFIDAGIRAREQAKASSRAATRRAKRFGEFEVGPESREPSEIQKHDLWEKPSNDPADW